MSISRTAAHAAHAVRSRYTLRRITARRGGRTRRPLCLVYGNCQAEPIRALLAGSHGFSSRFDAVRIPAVHEIGASQIPSFYRVLREASVIVAQPIKRDYRGL